MVVSLIGGYFSGVIGVIRAWVQAIFTGSNFIIYEVYVYSSGQKSKCTEHLEVLGYFVGLYFKEVDGYGSKGACTMSASVWWHC